MNPVCLDIYHGDSIESFHDAAGAGIKIVIAKAGEGHGYDPAFAATQARVESMAPDLLFGGYWFGHGSLDPRWQATLLLGQLHPGQVPVLDCERSGDPMSVAQAEAFCDYVDFALQGNLPILYYGEYLKGQDGSISDGSILRRCPGWVAQYGNGPVTGLSGSDIVLWQYTGDGAGPEPHTVPGVTDGANADLSIWSGSPADIPAFWAKHSLKAVAS